MTRPQDRPAPRWSVTDPDAYADALVDLPVQIGGSRDDGTADR